MEVLIAAIEGLQTLGLAQIVVSISCGGILHDLLGEQVNDAAINKAIAHKDVGALPEKTPNRAAIIALLQHDLESAKHTLPSKVALKLSQLQQLVAQVQNDCAIEVYADMLDVSAFPYHLGACFTLLDKVSRTEIGRGGCYHLTEGYYGCGVTLYVDNLLSVELNYPEVPELQYLSDDEFFKNGKNLRSKGIITLRNP
jgi:ATP phosphoribosyltransferase regulatory subunit HisZ